MNWSAGRVLKYDGLLHEINKTRWAVYPETLPHKHTHTHTVLIAIFPREPGLVDCTLNSASPFIPELRILLGQP